MKLNNKGFSLIELMVVVAIIAILATVAIPQYQQFQAKSRRQEGLTLLSSYFTAAKATYADLAHYPGNFVATGFQPSGQIHARITAGDNATMTPLGHPNDDGCTTTSAMCATAGYGNMVANAWTEETLGSWLPNADNAGAAMAMDDSFTTVSSSMIDNDGSETIDTWTINQQKTFANTRNGLL